MASCEGFGEGDHLLSLRLQLHLLLHNEVLKPPQLTSQVLALLRMPLALQHAEAEVCL